jgi:hypothetical protein
MLVALGRHRDQLAPDQLGAFVLVQDSGGDHGLDISDSEAAPLEALGSPRDAPGEEAVQRLRLPSRGAAPRHRRLSKLSLLLRRVAARPR